MWSFTSAIVIFYSLEQNFESLEGFCNFTEQNCNAMDNRIRVYCENTASYIDVAMGTSLLGLLADLEIENSEKYLAAYVNNRLKELNYRVYTPISIRFIDITHFEGHRVYQRTVTFFLKKLRPITVAIH